LSSLVSLSSDEVVLAAAVEAGMGPSCERSFLAGGERTAAVVGLTVEETTDGRDRSFERRRLATGVRVTVEVSKLSLKSAKELGSMGVVTMEPDWVQSES